MLKILQLITEVVGWLQIVASPFIAGLIIGGTVYLLSKNTIGLVVGIAIALIGLVVGILWATRIWRSTGTVNFMSRVSATPELDEKKSE